MNRLLKQAVDIQLMLLMYKLVRGGLTPKDIEALIAQSTSAKGND